MDLYVVCMDSTWVRDTQMFDTRGFSEEEMTYLDMSSEENINRWHDMEPCPFVGIVSADSDDEACQKAGMEYRYDPRSLFAIKVNANGGNAK